MNNYIGDIAEDADVYLCFDTADSTGLSITATIVVADIEVYRQNTGAIGLTQRSSTTGFTLDVDHDAMTGTHMVAIDTSDNTDAGFFATAYDYFVKLNTITVDGISISKWIGHFSIQNRYSAGALRPTTAARTLDVTATGAAGIDWANVENQSTAVDLSATDIQLADTTTTLTNLPAITSNWLTAAGINANALDGKGDWNTTTPPTAIAIADQVWEETLADHSGTGGSTAEALNAAGAAGDPWSTAIPGAYGAGTAGKILGDNIDAPISTVDTVVDAIKAVTDLLPDAGALNDLALILTDTTEIGTAGAGLTDITLNAASIDLVWDEVLTGATHNVTNSAGKRLRQIDAAFEVHSGTARVTSTSTTIDLEIATADNVTDEIYAGDRCVIVAGTGVGEHGLILSYNSTTQVATMSKAWVITPDATSEYILSPADCDVELWNDNAVTGDGDWAALKADTATTLIDTNELQTDWTDGGRLDALLDGVKAVTDVLPDAGALNDLALILADTGTDGVVLSASYMNAISDHVWRRTWANVEASSDGDTVTFRSGLGAVAKLVNKVAIVSTDLITYRDDDTTAFGTQALTTDASADPITAMDTV